VLIMRCFTENSTLEWLASRVQVEAAVAGAAEEVMVGVSGWLGG
jgi:hypothetical protein